MVPLLRAAVTWCLVALGTWKLGPGLLAAPQGAPHARLTAADSVTTLAAWALLACLSWALWVVTVLVCEALALRTGSGRPGIAHGVPAWTRRYVLGACGIATLSMGMVPGAHADLPAPPSPTPTDVRDGPTGGANVRRLLPLPDRVDGRVVDRPARRVDRSVPVPTSAPSSTPTSTPTDSPTRHRIHPSRRPRVVGVVVRPGECLWSIARDLLPLSATDQDVAALVVRIHADNRALIGVDPDLIHPGQRLQLRQERNR